MERSTVRHLTIALAGWFALAGLTACIATNRFSVSAQPTPPATTTPAMTAPPINPQLVTADNQFGFKLFSQLIQQEDSQNIQNMMISPTSVAIALSMLYNGARGETQQQIATTLELQGLSLEDLNQTNADLATALENADPEVQLAIANSLWGNQAIVFKPDFIERMQSFYHGEVETLDFIPDFSPGWAR